MVLPQAIPIPGWCVIEGNRGYDLDSSILKHPLADLTVLRGNSPVSLILVLYTQVDSS